MLPLANFPPLPPLPRRCEVDTDDEVEDEGGGGDGMTGKAGVLPPFPLPVRLGFGGMPPFDPLPSMINCKKQSQRTCPFSLKNRLADSIFFVIFGYLLNLT